MKCFIDCHCHVFNIVDVPAYLTLMDKLQMSTIERLQVAIAAFIHVADGKLPKSELEKHKEFIQFFESSIENNIQMLVGQIRTYLTECASQPDTTDILITPLLMDFDILLKDKYPKQVERKPSIREQYDRIVTAIASPVIQTIPHIKVCPFIGLDLRKLQTTDKDRLTGFKTFWEQNNTLATDNTIDSLTSGKLLGIKLYPPLGFNPSPVPLPPQYEDFYQWCCDQDIPLTVHCQKGSFSTGQDQQQINDNTTPANWEILLNSYDLGSLRINFAHFGGEDGLDDMIERFNSIDENSWTYRIIKLLKKYPNTYADISAYDYSKKKHQKTLVKIFEMDDKGNFDSEGSYPLVDKLLWGSDVPMVISDESYCQKEEEKQRESHYKFYIESFIKTIYSSDTLSSQQKEFIIGNLTERNPKRFLRII